jgi:hypothetical protein
MASNYFLGTFKLFCVISGENIYQINRQNNTGSNENNILYLATFSETTDQLKINIVTKTQTA